MPLYAAGVGLAGLLLFGFARGTRHALRYCSGLLLLFAGTIWLVSCTNTIVKPGPAAGGTPAGSYILLVSGTAGNMTHTTRVALVVQ
jgi:hypothetical protein